MKLPERTICKFYGDDFDIVGEGMTAERFQEIVNTMTADEKARCIGWRCVGRILAPKP